MFNKKLLVLCLFCLPLLASHTPAETQVATHEIGHALIACKHGLDVHSINICPNRFQKGYTDFSQSSDPHKTIQVYLGGIAAEELLLSTKETNGGRDLAMALNLLRQNRDQFKPHLCEQACINEQLAITKRLLEEDIDLAFKMRDALLESKRLKGHQFYALLDTFTDT